LSPQYNRRRRALTPEEIHFIQQYQQLDVYGRELAYTGRLWDRSNAKTDLGLAPWVRISAKAPPTLLIHAMNDPTDNVRHSMAYALALNEAGVPVDMRIYAMGGHAFGMRPTTDPITTEWPAEVKQWLHDIGML
jgi:acetyl esterase/lipase